MNCKICGFPLEGSEKVCKNCGSSLGTEVKEEVEEELLEESEVKDTPLLNKTLMSSVNDTYDKISNITEDSLKEKRKPINSLKDNINNKSSFSTSLNYNGGMTNNVYSKRKSNNKLLVVAFVIIVFVIIYLLVILALPNLKDYNCESANTNNQENVVVNKNTVSVSFEGYTFDMITDLIYEMKSDGIVVTDQNKSWNALVEVFPMSYEEVLNANVQIKQTFIKQGFKEVSYSEKSIGDVKFLIFELTGKEKNVIVAINKADGMESFITILENKDNTFNTSGLEKIGLVLKSSKKNGGSESDSKDVDYAEIIEDVIG